jgi:hypothetical protein
MIASTVLAQALPDERSASNGVDEPLALIRAK